MVLGESGTPPAMRPWCWPWRGEDCSRSVWWLAAGHKEEVAPLQYLIFPLGIDHTGRATGRRTVGLKGRAGRTVGEFVKGEAGHGSKKVREQHLTSVLYLRGIGGGGAFEPRDDVGAHEPGTLEGPPTSPALRVGPAATPALFCDSLRDRGRPDLGRWCYGGCGAVWVSSVHSLQAVG